VTAVRAAHVGRPGDDLQARGLTTSLSGPEVSISRPRPNACERKDHGCWRGIPDSGMNADYR